MCVRFLIGEDKDFIDYSQIDNNEMYDNIDQMNQDREDAYFDSEPPCNTSSNGEYTGILDY